MFFFFTNMLVPIANRANILAKILTKNVGSNVGQHVGTVCEGFNLHTISLDQLKSYCSGIMKS